VERLTSAGEALAEPGAVGYQGSVAKDPKYTIASLHPVGRYAVGVTWGDKHESILPLASLRRFCPCLDCEKSEAAKREPSGSASKLEGELRLADASILFHWADDHETLFLVEELRAAPLARASPSGRSPASPYIQAPPSIR
jgi:hypothetical protein